MIDHTPPQLARRLPLPPQMTRRVGVLGVLAFALFGIITFRLWYLQVLTGPQNVAVATANDQRAIPLQAPRGDILDADGAPLATTQVGAEATITADYLPPAHSHARWQVYVRLGRLLHLPTAQVWQVIHSQQFPGYQPAPVKDNLTNYELTYLELHAHEFPGVAVAPVNLRKYPLGDVAAAVLGEIGPITKLELGTAQFKGVGAGTYIGQAGLEREYNGYLQGKVGVEKVQVDAAGYPTGAAKITPPVAGDELQTSIHLGLEQEGYAAAEHAMAVARHNGDPADVAAFIAMDPFTGRVYALGSLPSYDPSVFDTPFSNKTWDALEYTTPAPLFDYATDGLYPTGSTFKPITALAGLHANLITGSTLQGATTTADGKGPCIQISTVCFHNSGAANYGDLDLVQALTVSEDTYFYRVGAAANGTTGNGLAIQDEARALGLGRSPGIDLPGGGQAGLVPDARVIAARNAQIVAQQCEPGTPPTRPKPAFAHEQIWITTCTQGYYYAPWTIGQDVELATGQGQLLASPLQMAVAYSAIVNGGTVWQPQIASRILSPSGQLVEDLPAPTASGHVDINSYDRSLVMEGLHDAAQSPLGTSYATFGTFPRPVYGKTGTAVHTGKKDQSWYVAYAPDARRPIVIAMTIEQGGFGAAAAAPAVRLMLSQWFGLPKKFVAGTNSTL